MSAALRVDDVICMCCSVCLMMVGIYEYLNIIKCDNLLGVLRVVPVLIEHISLHVLSSHKASGV